MVPFATDETREAAPAQAIMKIIPKKKLSNIARPIESIILALYLIFGIKILPQHFFIRVLTPAAIAD